MWHDVFVLSAVLAKHVALIYLQYASDVINVVFTRWPWRTSCLFFAAFQSDETYAMWATAGMELHFIKLYLSVMFHSWIWAVMLRRISKWRFICSKNCLDWICRRQFCRCRLLFWYASCLFSFLWFILLERVLTNATGEKSVSALTVEVIIYYETRPWLLSHNNVIFHSNIKLCWCSDKPFN